MEDDITFIPRSARIEFQFHMNRSTEIRPEFRALREETEMHVNAFRTTLKIQIIKATKLEIQTMKDEIRLEFLKAIRIAVEAFLVGEGIENLSTHKVVSSIMKKIARPCSITHISLTMTSFADSTKLLLDF